ncbi:MAG: glycosyltransferase family 4 protein [Candidatus Bathyarchaeota archaeon]|nr:glycosyltransferase family 4 protein [Candidatus Bathyarchaeota archaeon]HGJ66023.1 glycosyltransferase family 1 protein [bacterium]
MIKKKLRILMLTPFFSPNIGGVETHLDDLCNFLRNNGHEVFVLTYKPLTTDAETLSFEKHTSIEIRRINWVGNNLFHKLEPYPIFEFIYLTPLLFVYSFFFMAAVHKKIDVIHAHGINAAFIGKVLGKIYRKKVIVSIHAIYDLPKKPLLAKLLKLTLSSSTVLTLARKSKEELIKIGLDKQKIAVYTYWVNQSIFKPLNRLGCKQQLGLEYKFVVLFVGRLLEIKGVKNLLRVASRIVNKKDISFVFIGDGPLSTAVKSASVNMGNVIYLGKIDNAQLGLYYNAADVLIIPSIYEEGFGRVILEALSCGTPVIASNKGGIPEALDPSIGILVEPNVDDLYHALISLYERKNLEALRKCCRLYAEARFGIENAYLIEQSYVS